jgi:FkbM family methyltransferase
MNRTDIHRLLNRALPQGSREQLRELAITLIPSMRHLDMWTRLEQLAGQGFQPNVIFDVGAATGDWARRAFELWPDAQVVGFEPNVSRRSALEALAAERSQFSFHSCFLGREAQVVKYRERGNQTSVYFGEEDASAEAKMESLDDLLAKGSLRAPEFIKLDVQGAELDVLAGGEQALASAQVVMAEVSLYRLSEHMPTAFELWQWMNERGFALYDIVSFLRRPKDDALFQMDFVFLRRSNPLFRDSWE